MTPPEVIAAIKDVLLGVAAATTALVAVIGLNRWRRELEGKAHFDAARNLIRATYRFREALQDCRAPFYSVYEYPEGYKGTLGGHSPSEEAQAWAHIYRNRWSPVMAAVQEFDSCTLEAEALWGSSIRVKTKALRQCASEVQGAIDADLRNKAASGQDFERDRNYGVAMRGLLSAAREDDKNPLNQQIARAIGGLEEELRPHLRRN